MVSNSLFDIQSIQSELEMALYSALFDFGEPYSSAESWAITSLQNNVEQAAGKIANSKNTMSSGFGVDPPGHGFRVTFGLQILVGYKIRLRGNANIGYGNRWGNFGATSSLHFAVYNGGIGTGIHKKDLVVDVTAAVNLTVGGGQGTALQSYSLNYNSPIPTLNDFENSFSYGQLLTWNSGVNENQFSLDRIQREGMIGFRLGDVNVSTNNDTRRLYLGGGTDMAWTGGISVATPFFEVGFQDFSGDYSRKDDEKRDFILDQIKEAKKNNNISKFQKEIKISELEVELKKLTSNYHNQTSYQKKLNKASTYIRVNNNGYNATVDLIGDAWLQNAIHSAIKDFKFEYNYKNIEVWGGKNW
ncbi:hypothetical protein [Aquimarina sediminis]|uniref:hypothetical protein n=1 Tax=Aquimarina sediminis TaxID=2070536 RepID=UPI000FFE6F89|nr:hypothetical protein [Aquimarina sediminis]